MFFLFVFLSFLKASSFGNTLIPSTKLVEEYRGYFLNSRLGVAHYADLTVIKNGAPVDGGEQPALAILVLWLGGRDSMEYLSFQFPNVRITPDGRSALFGSSGFGPRLSHLTWAADGREIEMSVSFGGSRNLGKLVVSRAGVTLPSHLPIHPPLAGDHEAEACRNRKETIRIFTSRNPNSYTANTNPYGVYRIQGAHGWLRRARTPLSGNSREDREVLQTLETFSDGFYSFHTGRLELQAHRLNCQLQRRSPQSMELGWQCGNCFFSTLFQSTAEWQRLRPPPPPYKNQRVAASPHRITFSTEQIGGDWEGYLFHEKHGAYQSMELELNVSETGMGPERRRTWDARSQLFFGDPANSNEQLIFRSLSSVTTPETPNVMLASDPFISDGIMVLDHFSETLLEGTWYSWFFGRIGRFRLSRTANSILYDSDKYPLIPEISGVYLLPIEGGVRYPLKMALGISVRPNSDFFRGGNPLASMQIVGYSITNALDSFRTEFVGGSYDFFSGGIRVGENLVGTLRVNHSGLFPEWEFRLGATSSNRTEPMPLEGTSRLERFSSYRIYRSRRDIFP